MIKPLPAVASLTPQLPTGARYLAQDFLLAHLVEQGVLGGLVVFKGGTALRKLFAGAQGRFR